MPNRNVDLTEHDDSFIDAGVTAGRFRDASEAVGAGPHLLERQKTEDEAKMEWLRGAAQEAFAEFDQGEGVSLLSADDLDTLVNNAIEEGRAARRAIRG